MASWDHNEHSTHIEPYSTVPESRGLSVSSPNNFNALPRYSVPVHPQYNFYEPSMQPYRPTSFQPKIVSIPPQGKAAEVSKPKSCTDRITISHGIGFLSGLIFLGIPLCVMITIYMLYSSNSSGTTSSTTISTAVNLPYQCTIYSAINDATRYYTYISGCCASDNGYNGWYRFTGSSGSQLVTYPQNPTYCGTSSPGWWNGTHPTTIGATVMGTLCANYGGYICNPSYSTSSILATNCSGYYVYYLRPLYCCGIYTRYCTM